MLKRWLKRGAWGLAGLVVLLVAASLVLFVATSGSYEVAATVTYDPALPRATINGTTLHLRTFGEPNRPAVVVLHGGPGNSFKYLLPLSALADQYYVIFYDQRGSGLSAREPDAKLTLAHHLADLDAIITHYGGGQAHLIGHSWGAMLATAYTAAHPERVGQLVLAEPGFLTDATAAEFVRRTHGMMPPLTPNNLAIVTRIFFESLHIDGPDADARSDYLAAQVMGSTALTGHPIAGYFCNQDLNTAALADFRFGVRAAQAVLGAATDARGDFHVDFTTGLSRYERPVLFLSGACNQIIGEDIQRQHMAFFKAAELVAIPDAGHTMLGENPEASLRAIRPFLGR
jgi:proline iminopeptidase